MSFNNFDNNITTIQSQDRRKKKKLIIKIFFFIVPVLLIAVLFIIPAIRSYNFKKTVSNFYYSVQENIYYLNLIDNVIVKDWDGYVDWYSYHVIDKKPWDFDTSDFKKVKDNAMFAHFSVLHYYVDASEYESERTADLLFEVNAMFNSLNSYYSLVMDKPDSYDNFLIKSNSLKRELKTQSNALKELLGLMD